jgi:hypothetical protein
MTSAGFGKKKPFQLVSLFHFILYHSGFLCQSFDQRNTKAEQAFSREKLRRTVPMGSFFAT